MVKVTGPFLSLDARGTLADTLTGSFWRGINYIRTRVVPNNPRSTKQVEIREVLTDGVSRWKFNLLPAGHKEMWDNYAKGTAESGFNRYMRFYIKANYTGSGKVDPAVIPDPQ